MHSVCKKWSRTCLIKEDFLEISKLLLASKAKEERVGKELTSWMMPGHHVQVHIPVSLSNNLLASTVLSLLQSIWMDEEGLGPI